jgi:hypothetical protein
MQHDRLPKLEIAFVLLEVTSIQDIQRDLSFKGVCCCYLVSGILIRVGGELR